jgi:hypothetical protein
MQSVDVPRAGIELLRPRGMRVFVYRGTGMMFHLHLSNPVPFTLTCIDPAAAFVFQFVRGFNPTLGRRQWIFDDKHVSRSVVPPEIAKWCEHHWNRTRELRASCIDFMDLAAPLRAMIAKQRGLDWLAWPKERRDGSEQL